jgi:hypothetical protein
MANEAAPPCMVSLQVISPKDAPTQLILQEAQ